MCSTGVRSLPGAPPSVDQQFRLNLHGVASAVWSPGRGCLDSPQGHRPGPKMNAMSPRWDDWRIALTLSHLYRAGGADGEESTRRRETARVPNAVRVWQ